MDEDFNNIKTLNASHPERSEEPALSLPKGPLLVVEQALKQRSFAALRMTRKGIRWCI